MNSKRFSIYSNSTALEDRIKHAQHCLLVVFRQERRAFEEHLLCHVQRQLAVVRRATAQPANRQRKVERDLLCTPSALDTVG